MRVFIGFLARLLIASVLEFKGETYVPRLRIDWKISPIWQ